jgi:hypothetical protein
VAPHAEVRPNELPQECLQLLRDQDGVIAAWRAAAAGISAAAIRSQLRNGRWRALHRGVYATFTGKPTRGAELWAARLRAGPTAVLSHQTAGPGPVPGPAFHRLADWPTGSAELRARCSGWN